jgi:hypothetical protein
MHSLSLDEIERFASRRGVNKSAIKDFFFEYCRGGWY